MIEVEGKVIYETIDELIDPVHTAVVVVDMQNDFCKPGYAWDNYQIPISAFPSLIPRLAALISGARLAGVLVIYVQMTVLPGRVIESAPQLRFLRRLHMDLTGDDSPLLYTVEGTSGQQIITELAPQDGDVVVKKYRSSGFWGTNLDMLLRSNKVETVIVTGCTTEGCVESTARDALFNDYYVVVPEDCVASDDQTQHDASLILMRHRFDMTHLSEILATWEQRHLSQMVESKTPIGVDGDC